MRVKSTMKHKPTNQPANPQRPRRRDNQRRDEVESVEQRRVDNAARGDHQNGKRDASALTLRRRQQRDVMTAGNRRETYAMILGDAVGVGRGFPAGDNPMQRQHAATCESDERRGECYDVGKYRLYYVHRLTAVNATRIHTMGKTATSCHSRLVASGCSVTAAEPQSASFCHQRFNLSCQGNWQKPVSSRVFTKTLAAL